MPISGEDKSAEPPSNTQLVSDRAIKLQIDRDGQARCSDLPDTQYEEGRVPTQWQYGQHSKRAPVWLTKGEARGGVSRKGGRNDHEPLLPGWRQRRPDNAAPTLIKVISSGQSYRFRRYRQLPLAP